MGEPGFPHVSAGIPRVVTRTLAVAALAALCLASDAVGATIRGTATANLLRGGPTADTILAGRGDDRVRAQGGGRDRIACGAGRDIVTADLVDTVDRDCEVVGRQLSSDPYTQAPAQHRTEVEPDSASFGSTVVTAFQVGRYTDGASMNTGWATSTDAGRTWRSGFLPGLTVFSTTPGTTSRVSDPTVSYDAVHRVWLIASLGIEPGSGTSLLVSRSTDGLIWSPPVRAAFASVGTLAYDKEWLSCDNWATSPFRGNCYLSYSDLVPDRQSTQTSRDGGLTWGPPVGAAGGASSRDAVGSQPVVRPNGDLVNVYLGPRSLRALRSTDGGATFAPETFVSEVSFDSPFGLRGGPLPSADVDASGTISVAWPDCRFTPNCSSNDIVVARSADGVSWTGPVRVPTEPGDRVTPGLVADPAGSALALTYYTLPASCSTFAGCTLNASTIRSRDGGASWTAPQRLSAEPMPLGWLASTDSGRMVGDYVSTSFAGRNVVSVVALATAPGSGTRFEEAIFATALAR